MNILKLIAGNGFITYNKYIAKRLGINEAILIGELCSVASLFNFEEFFFSREKIIEDTSLTDRAVKLATQNLIKNKIITVVKKGLPCKYYYTIHEDVLISYLQENVITSALENNGTSACNIDSTGDSKNDSTSACNIDSTGTCKSDSTISNNNTRVIIQSKNLNNNVQNSQKQTHFQKPTVEDVRAYCQERNNNVDWQKFYDYYESNGWLVGRNKMKDWKASVRTWERNNFDKQKNYGSAITQCGCDNKPVQLF